jgi:hypothetical protein
MQPASLPNAVALTSILALAVTGCASGGKLHLDMAKSCQAHGGTWSQSQETCSMAASGSYAPKHARDICGSQGGVYLPGGTCMIEGVK